VIYIEQDRVVLLLWLIRVKAVRYIGRTREEIRVRDFAARVCVERFADRDEFISVPFDDAFEVFDDAK